MKYKKTELIIEPGTFHKNDETIGNSKPMEKLEINGGNIWPGISNPTSLLIINENSGHIGNPNNIIDIIQKPSFKLDFTKVNNLNELLWLLNKIDLHINASNLKYDELKSRFS